jgi:hypothetical protein
MSTGTFSSTMFAVEKSPTSQPARVNGTHGAGVVSPFALGFAGSEYTIDGALSVVDGARVAVLYTGEVQYTNEPSGSVLPSGWYVLNVLLTGMPCRSGYRPV